MANESEGGTFFPVFNWDRRAVGVGNEFLKAYSRSTPTASPHEIKPVTVTELDGEEYRKFQDMSLERELFEVGTASVTSEWRSPDRVRVRRRLAWMLKRRRTHMWLERHGLLHWIPGTELTLSVPSAQWSDLAKFSDEEMP